MPIDDSGGVIDDVPHLDGTRIAVHHVVHAWTERDYSTEEIADRVYPHLSEQQVIEAIQWAFEHRGEYEERLSDQREHAREVTGGLASGPEDLEYITSPDE